MIRSHPGGMPELRVGEHCSIKQGVYIRHPRTPPQFLLNILLYLGEYLAAPFRTGFSQFGGVLLQRKLAEVVHEYL